MSLLKYNLKYTKGMEHQQTNLICICCTKKVKYWSGSSRKIAKSDAFLRVSSQHLKKNSLKKKSAQK